MIYEHLTIQINLTRCERTYTYECDVDEEPRSETMDFKIVTRSLPGLSILATCELVNNEALPILTAGLNDIMSQPPRILLDIRAATSAIRSPGSPLAALIGYGTLLKKHPMLTYRGFLSEAKRAHERNTNADAGGRDDDEYFQAYPFHHYKWMFYDRTFAKSIEKAGHQLAFHRPDNDTRILEIGITNASPISPHLFWSFADAFERVLWQYFGDTSVTIIVRPVLHLCTGDDISALGELFSTRPAHVYGGIYKGGAIYMQEWKRDWAAGDAQAES